MNGGVSTLDREVGGFCDVAYTSSMSRICVNNSCETTTRFKRLPAGLIRPTLVTYTSGRLSVPGRYSYIYITLEVEEVRVALCALVKEEASLQNRAGVFRRGLHPVRADPELRSPEQKLVHDTADRGGLAGDFVGAAGLSNRDLGLGRDTGSRGHGISAG